MRIGIQTWGSEGDVRPFIALACGLADAGHQVTLVITGMFHPDHATVCEHAGVTLRQAATLDAETMLEVEALMDRIVFRRTLPIDQLTMIMDAAFTPFDTDMEQAARDLCKENDLVIGHFICHHLSTLAKVTGINHVSVTLSPGMVITGDRPPLPLPHLGRTLNRLMWRLVDHLVTRRLAPYANPLRKAEGLAPITSALGQEWCSPLLNLIGVSPLFYPRGTDWPENTHATGFFALPEKALPWEPEAELMRFLEAGPPPVLFTFGSMLPRSENLRQDVWNLMADAAKLAGCRALIHTGYETEGGLTLPDDMLAVGRVPFDRLMPRCAAVVHHGGSGTSQTATRAGRPQVVVEHLTDQVLWGTILKRLGIAPAPLHRRTVTPKKLARAVKKAVGHAAMEQAAGQAGEQLCAEDGVARAVALVEALEISCTA